MSASRRKKRGPGEGSVYKDKSRGGWRWKGPRDEYGHREEGRAKTYEDARIALKRAVDRHDEGLASRGAKQSLEQYLTGWLRETVPLSVGESSEVIYRRVVGRHIVPSIGRVRVADLQPRHVRTLQGDLRAKGLAPASIEQAQAILRSALEDARVVHNLIQHNAARDVPAPRSRAQPVNRWTDDEVARLLKAARGERLEAFYVLAAYTGLRLGELLGLQWEDVDFEGRRLRVRTQLQRRRGEGLVLVELKSDASRRDLPLGKACIEALHAHRERQEDERAAADGWADAPAGLVFTTGTGRGIGKEYVNSRLFHRIRDRASVPEHPFKTFRATVPTMLAEAGVSPKVVQEYLGHADIATTLKFYTAVSDESKAQAAEVVAGRLEF